MNVSHGPNPTVFTIGYEGRQPEELVALLAEHGVRVLVDVRLNAISRRRGFSKRQLASTLAEAGILYVHEPPLGNPRDNRQAYRDGEPAAKRRFGRHLSSNGAEALQRVRDQIRAVQTALLCVEREPGQCHRTAVASHLEAAVVSL